MGFSAPAHRQRRFSKGSESVHSLFCGSCFEQRALPFLLGIWRPRRDWNALTRHFASEINISEHARSASLLANTAGNSLACLQVLEQRYKSSKLSNRCSMLRGSQQLEATIRKYGCPPQRKIPKVEGIQQNNCRTGIFDQWRSFSRWSSVIGERLVAFSAVV